MTKPSSDGESADVDMETLLLNAGPRKTTSEFILRVEDEALQAGRAVGNPAEPVTDDAIPRTVRDTIGGLETVGGIEEFIEQEAKRGPRHYVIALANKRKAELEVD